jgi:hypothetical protein
MITFKEYLKESLIKEYVTAYHGTSANFNKFNITKVGTGESSAKYGYGLYFTTEESVAEYYADRAATTAFVYEVDLFNKRPNLIEFDIPLSSSIGVDTLADMSKVLNGAKIIDAIYNKTSALSKDRNFDELFQRVLVNLTDNEAWDNLKDSVPKFNWDKFYDILKKADFELYPEEETYYTLYQTLNHVLGNGLKIVKFLKQFGIDGVIVDGTESDEAKTIVVFDDKDIRIVGKKVIKNRK